MTVDNLLALAAAAFVLAYLVYVLINPEKF